MRYRLSPTASRQIAAAYLATQAALVAAWWALLMAVPESRGLFRDPAAPDTALLAFWLADWALVVAGSAAAALLVWRSHPARAPALWLLSGALGYAALYCVGLSALTGAALLASALMLSASLLTLGVTWQQTR
jgi:hypothetical protein